MHVRTINSDDQEQAGMRQVKEMADPYVSRAAASKAAGVNQTQFDRWVQAGALVDDDGQVWIKTAKPVKGWKL